MVFSKNPSLKARPPQDLIRQHVGLWSVFRRRINLSDLKICWNSNAQCDPRIIPEEIFVSDIEPTLNGSEDLSLLANKSLYYKLFDPSLFPKPYLHIIDGRPHDSHLTPISQGDLENRVRDLPYPVLLKPNKGTAGGEGVHIIKGQDQLCERIGMHRDLVIQEVVSQHVFFKKFNLCGLNTIRVNLYRSVTDDAVKLLDVTLRIGVGGSLDNETAGGIVVHIDRNGRLNGTARDKYATPYKKHPDTQLAFDEEIPFFNELKATAITFGETVVYGRIFSLDLYLNETGEWRLIEVNMHGHAVRLAQYAGEAFFGEYTDEVVDYCLREHWALRQPG